MQATSNASLLNLILHASVRTVVLLTDSDERRTRSKGTAPAIHLERCSVRKRWPISQLVKLHAEQTTRDRRGENPATGWDFGRVVRPMLRHVTVPDGSSQSSCHTKMHLIDHQCLKDSVLGAVRVVTLWAQKGQNTAVPNLLPVYTRQS